MNETANRSKLRQLDRLIIKVRKNINMVTAEVQLSNTETHKSGLSELEKKAREEILKDAMLGIRRYEITGPQGWKKPSCLKTNKKFLERMLRSSGSKSSK
ncbi:hypothetical protein QQG55_43515 [Brugia pahangi]|uniref:Mediator of RNA polymerase II transcription subunit 4 n=1 Tax=Brugia pahangi TaxID=6280 RepID=A0A0N4SYD9_BRUPA|nr:unnamed protein product [Brugia pahangi]